MEPVIEIEGLVVSMGGRRVLDGLHLQVPRGCVYALLGGNGAGKTTTLNVLLGLVAAEEGTVKVVGGVVQHDAAASLAYLPENVALFPYLSGVENLVYFCALAGHKVSPADARERLAGTGLPAHAADCRVSTYSKGMRQKVGLAIAYARRAPGMLLDEPTSGLDPAAANDFSRQVRHAAEQGMGILMATHDLFNARQVADRIGIMRGGRIVAERVAGEVDHATLEALYLEHARAPDAVMASR